MFNLFTLIRSSTGHQQGGTSTSSWYAVKGWLLKVFAQPRRQSLPMPETAKHPDAVTLSGLRYKSHLGAFARPRNAFSHSFAFNGHSMPVYLPFRRRSCRYPQGKQGYHKAGQVRHEMGCICRDSETVRVNTTWKWKCSSKQKRNEMR